MPCNCGIGTLLVLYVAILAQYPLGQGTPRNLACGYMPRSPGKRVAPCAAWPTLRVVGLCFGFYLLPNHPLVLSWWKLKRSNQQKLKHCQCVYHIYVYTLYYYIIYKYYIYIHIYILYIIYIVNNISKPSKPP
jgi:hypothetical protein